MEIKLVKNYKKIQQLIKRKPGKLFNLCPGSIFWSPLSPQQFLIQNFYILLAVFKRQNSSKSSNSTFLTENIICELRDKHGSAKLMLSISRNTFTSLAAAKGQSQRLKQKLWAIKKKRQHIHPQAKSLDLHPDSFFVWQYPCSSSALILYPYKTNIF